MFKHIKSRFKSNILSVKYPYIRLLTPNFGHTIQQIFIYRRCSLYTTKQETPSDAHLCRSVTNLQPTYHRAPVEGINPEPHLPVGQYTRCRRHVPATFSSRWSSSTSFVVGNQSHLRYGAVHNST